MKASFPPSSTFILDLSRLLARAGHAVPTGIDRVELAYAEYLLTHLPTQSCFVALSLSGSTNKLPFKMVRAFITALLDGWNNRKKDSLPHARTLARQLKAICLVSRPPRPFPGPTFYLLLSHHHLMRLDVIRRFLNRTKALFVPMVHDLIPIEYPEYARPREYKRHVARMHTVISLAESVIVPTRTVQRTLSTYSAQQGRTSLPIWTVSHGVFPHNVTRHQTQLPRCTPKDGRAFFVYLSTIEPRKNHLLLLHLWRQMVGKRGKDKTPILILIGRRGWENENILDLLDRCPALQETVIEENSLSDEDVTTLLKTSNGLLFPSFTEGYGLPIAEAMNLSVPSICADIPVLREVGEDYALYVDPLDSVSWQKAIDDFAHHGPLWQHQKNALSSWKPYPWDKSIQYALTLCQNLTTSKRH